MARYYCDYCDIFLTHDSLAVRKAHNSGWKHATAVREYYSTLGQDTTQGVIDQITSAYHSNAFNQGGPHFPPQLGPPPAFNFGRPPTQLQQQTKQETN